MWIQCGTSTGRRTQRAAPPAGAPTVYVQAPAELVRASTKFLETWLVKRDVDSALGYISAQCNDCVKTEPQCGSAAAEVSGGGPGAVEEGDAERH